MVFACKLEALVNEQLHVNHNNRHCPNGYPAIPRKSALGEVPHLPGLTPTLTPLFHPTSTFACHIMSLQGLISGAECAVPFNPLSQVLKHTEGDRSLQQVCNTNLLTTSAAFIPSRYRTGLQDRLALG